MESQSGQPGDGIHCGSLYSDIFPENNGNQDGSQRDSSAFARSPFSANGLSSPRRMSFPETMVDLEGFDFSDREEFSDIDLSKTRITTIGENTFQNCDNLSSVKFPACLKTIGEKAFLDCKNLTKITFAPDSTLVSIGVQAFYGCGIKSLIVPPTVKTIEEEAFGDCEFLTSIILPKKTHVHHTAFIGCTRLPPFMLANLTWIKSETDNETYEEDIFETLVINDNVSEEMYRGNDTIRFVKVAYGVEHIAAGAFEGCTSLETLELPGTLLSFGNYAFRGCKSLLEVVIPSSVEVIEKELFADCTSLQKVKLSSSTKIIYDKAFENCESLENIRLPKSLKDIHKAAFKNCSSLKSITIPQGISFFGGSLFEGCVSLEEVEFDKGVNIAQIKERTFFQCRALKECVLPDSVTAIGKSAFFECESLLCSSLNFHEGLALIDDYAYASCSSIESLRFPRSTNFIGTRAFRGCKSLRKITFLNPDIKFVYKAFSHCVSLESVKGLPDDDVSVKDILKKELFYLCRSLETPLGNELHLAAEGKCWAGDHYPPGSEDWIQHKIDELNKIDPDGEHASFLKDYNGDTAFQCAVRGGAPTEFLNILARGTDKNGKTHLDLFAEKNARIQAEDYTDDEIAALKAENSKLISATKIGEGVHYLNSFVELLGSSYFDPRTVPEFIEKLNMKFETRTFAAILMLDILMPFIRVLAYSKVSRAYFDDEAEKAHTLWFVTIYLSLCYVAFREFLQIRDGFTEWITDFWNMIDLFIIITALLTTVAMQVTEYIPEADIWFVNCTLVITFFIWLYAILKLRVLAVNFAVFVGGMINIIWTLVPFLGVSVIVLGAFAQMYLLTSIKDYDNFYHALLFTYGEFLAFEGIPDAADGEEQQTAIRRKTIAAFYGFFVVVLLLNVVIAVASTAWEGVTERGRDDFLLYRTKLFLELQDFFVWMNCFNLVGSREDKYSLYPDANYYKVWKDSKSIAEVMRRVKKEGVGLVGHVVLYGIYLILGLFFGLTWPKAVRKRMFNIDNHEAINDKRSELANLLKEAEEDLEKLEKIDKHIQNKVDDEFLHLVECRGIPSRFELKKKIRDLQKKVLRRRKDVQNFKIWEERLEGVSKKKLFNYNEFIMQKS